MRNVLNGELGSQGELARRMSCVSRILAARNRSMGRPLRDDELADLAQDTMIRVWSKIGTFAGRASLETWIYRFCFLELMNFLRRRSRLPRTMTDLGDKAPPEPVARAEVSHDELPLESLMRHLAPREAQVIRYRHVEQVESLREIGELMGLSLSSVKTHYYRGLEKLRTLLENQVHEEGTIQ